LNEFINGFRWRRGPAQSPGNFVDRPHRVIAASIQICNLVPAGDVGDFLIDAARKTRLTAVRYSGDIVNHGLLREHCNSI
jgi:hypothetical protein